VNEFWLIQAEDSVSEVSSGPSSSSLNVDDTLPTTEDMMKRCGPSSSTGACTPSGSASDSEQESNDEFFFDARESERTWTQVHV